MEMEEVHTADLWATTRAGGGAKCQLRMQQQVKMTMKKPTKRTMSRAMRAIIAGSSMTFLGLALADSTLMMDVSWKERRTS